MASFIIPNVQVEGIVSCVPKTIQSVKECECLSGEDSEKLTNTTGIAERRVAGNSICTSDLCFTAAQKLIEGLGWPKEEIDALIFITQTPDYILPSTSPILQNRLGLSKDCFTLDISLGCSGYIHGIITLSNLISTGNIKRGLLLVGDTITKICSQKDKSTYPLFGDAGTATALSYNPEAKPIMANTFSDGNGYKSIIISDGGARNPFNSGSLNVNLISQGISRSNSNLILEGMDVFSFGITKAPEAVKNLFSTFDLSIDTTDFFVFHQANMLMNEKIRKKLLLPAEKVPYTLQKFGNTSGATIPLTMTVELKNHLLTRPCNLLLCGFGVGLSWGSVYIKSMPLQYVETIEL